LTSDDGPPAAERDADAGFERYLFIRRPLRAASQRVKRGKRNGFVAAQQSAAG
jgi:hypothetical protein